MKPKQSSTVPVPDQRSGKVGLNSSVQERRRDTARRVEAKTEEEVEKLEKLLEDVGAQYVRAE